MYYYLLLYITIYCYYITNILLYVAKLPYIAYTYISVLVYDLKTILP